MTKLTIIQGPSSLLNQKCDRAAIIPASLISDMWKLLIDADGLGLAAPQVGINARFFVTRWGEVFIDPVITRAGSPLYVNEGCLSYPGKSATKLRYTTVQVGSRTYCGIEAVVIQHELDHLNGITIETSDTVMQENL